MIAPAVLDNAGVTQRYLQLGLMEHPFAEYPDTRYFYPCIEHVSLYQKLQAGITGNSRNRLSLVIGEAGTGKTMLARRITNSVLVAPPGPLVSAHVEGKIPSPTKLLIQINDQLGLDKLRSLEERLALLRAFAENASQTGQTILLTIDADISFKVYKNVRKILDWTDSAGFPLSIRAIIFSRDNLLALEERMKAEDNPVGVRHTLGNLSYSSATSLLEERSKMAGRSAPLFNRDALSEIVEVTEGHPGQLIQYASDAFMKLVASDESMVSLQMVLQAQENR